jgi:hypothetical protein
MPTLGIRSYGIGVTSMEEVFLKVAKTVAEREDAEDGTVTVPMPGVEGTEEAGAAPGGAPGVKRTSDGARSTGGVTVDVKPWSGRAGA